MPELKDKMHNLEKNIGDGAEKMQDKTKAAADTAQKTAKNIAHSTEKQAEGAIDKVTHGLKNAEGHAKQEGRDFGDKAKEFAHKAGDAVEDIAEKAGDTFGKGIDMVKDLFDGHNKK